MDKLNSTEYTYNLTARDKKTYEIKFTNFTKQFTGNFLRVSTTQLVYDQYGYSMPMTTKEIRLDDYLVMTNLDQALSTSSQGSAMTITIYSVVTIVVGIALNKSLKELWNMIDTI